jgi:DNA-binding NarL/FixJ family response regulator
VAALLAPFSDRVAVVELDSGLPVAQDVDVVLYDTFGQAQGPEIDLDGLLNGNQAKVAIFSWNVQPEIVSRSLEQGASGYLSKGMDAEALVQALEDVHDGKVVLPAGVAVRDRIAGDWPGKTFGLSAREAEIIALITQGLSNQEIAQRSYLSINSVKTYIRTAYRKMGVTSRSQAVLWGVRNGFQPDVLRAVAVEPTESR